MKPGAKRSRKEKTVGTRTWIIGSTVCARDDGG